MSFSLSSRRTPGPITTDGYRVAYRFRKPPGSPTTLPSGVMGPGVRRDDERFKLCLPLPVSCRSDMPFSNHQPTKRKLEGNLMAIDFEIPPEAKAIREK